MSEIDEFEIDSQYPENAIKKAPLQKKKDPNRKASRCDDCEFFEEDDFGDVYCSISLDEDEMAEFMARNTGRCPYYRYYNEYKSVQKQN